MFYNRLSRLLSFKAVFKVGSHGSIVCMALPDWVMVFTRFNSFPLLAASNFRNNVDALGGTGGCYVHPDRAQMGGALEKAVRRARWCRLPYVREGLPQVVEQIYGV